MPAENADSTKRAISAIVAKLSSQILLFSLAIALVIVSAFAVSGQEALWPIVAVLLVFLVGAFLYVFAEKGKSGGAAATGSAEAMAAVPDKAEASLSVEVWVRNFDQSPTGDHRGEGRYRVGDRVRVSVRASRDCYLTLLNLSSDGSLTLLFPNRFHRDNWIEGGRVYEVPSDDYEFDIVLEEPAGEDRVKAIVTLDPRPLLESDFGPSGSFFHCIERTATPRAMKAVAREVERRDQTQWASASTCFTVEPAREATA